MSQWIKCLPYNHKTLSSGPLYPLKKLAIVVYNSRAEGAETSDPEVHGPASQAKLKSFRVSERPCLKTDTRGRHLMSTSGLHTCANAPVHTHTYMHTATLPIVYKIYMCTHTYTPAPSSTYRTHLHIPTLTNACNTHTYTPLQKIKLVRSMPPSRFPSLKELYMQWLGWG